MRPVRICKEDVIWESMKMGNSRSVGAGQNKPWHPPHRWQKISYATLFASAAIGVVTGPIVAYPSVKALFSGTGPAPAPQSEAVRPNPHQPATPAAGSASEVASRFVTQHDREVHNAYVELAESENLRALPRFALNATKYAGR